ncbi:nucleoid DNA-binding protein [Chryseobacterium limigenitum]
MYQRTWLNNLLMDSLMLSRLLLLKVKEVRIQGFGTFKVSKRAARKGINPRTGESIQIKATNVASFKAGKELKTRANK